MRRLLPLLIALVPLTAAGQVLSVDQQAQDRQLLGQAPAELRPLRPGGVPLWQGGHGQMLMLTATPGPATSHPAAGSWAGAPFSVGPVDDTSVMGIGLQYGLDPHVLVHAGLNQHAWIDPRAQRMLGSELGATYVGGRYSLDVSVEASHTAHPSLPRVLPGAAPGVNGLSDFDRGAQLSATGHLALGSKSGVDLGASVGRIRLLPGNLLGIDTLDQKALSFGVDRGPLSGTIVGRSLEPTIPGTLSADRRWNSIDLGVTWRLPWQGELSIGAQNLWSSGSPVSTPAGPEPDQSRTPYVQYHQDL